MQKKFLAFYKISLLISIAVIVAIIAFKVVRDPYQIAFIILGSLLGTFVLDMEYVLYAFFFEPEKDFSKTLAGFLKHGDLFNAAGYIQYHKHELKDQSLNSAIFQIAIAITSIFISYTNTNFFVKSLVLSIFANSIYKLIESYFENTLADWFWTLKTKPTKQAVIIYTASLICIFIFCLNVL